MMLIGSHEHEDGHAQADLFRLEQGHPVANDAAVLERLDAPPARRFRHADPLGQRGNRQRCVTLQVLEYGFLGTAIHDTAQVIGAGLLFEQLHPQSQALEIATVTKLLRNLCMLLVIPCMTVAYARRARSADDVAAECSTPSLLGAIPLFIVGFVVMSLVRTCGDLWFDVPVWPIFVDGLQQVSQVCLTVAMAAVGLGTRFSAIRMLGMQPLVVGFAAAAVVGVVSLSLIRLLVSGAI
ncbi:MAG: putative sulfate exporter family transporter [Gammaproteobacteria bacterium]|nr:MAG: putative sulfate exporter family transporter [Gammaproteobacteria bacterium]